MRSITQIKKNTEKESVGKQEWERRYSSKRENKKERGVRERFGKKEKHNVGKKRKESIEKTDNDGNKEWERKRSRRENKKGSAGGRINKEQEEQEKE